MDSKALLKDPQVSLSVAWAAFKDLFGDGVITWEPDTIRLELRRRGITDHHGLLSKLLGAQTIITTRSWTYDHDELFAFALACDGVPAAGEMDQHPTPEQLCWAMKEIAALTDDTPDEDHGFDQDTIDPAICVILMDEGMCVPPNELHFCWDVLEQLIDDSHQKLMTSVTGAWAKLKGEPLDVLRREISEMEETAVSVQLSRLADCRLFVAEAEERRAQQLAAHGS